MADKTQSDSQEKKQGGNRRKCGDADFALAYLFDTHRGEWLDLKEIRSAFRGLYGDEQDCLEGKALAKHLDSFVEWSDKTRKYFEEKGISPYPFPPRFEVGGFGRGFKRAPMRKYRLAHDRGIESLTDGFDSKFVVDRAQFALLVNNGVTIEELRRRCKDDRDDWGGEGDQNENSDPFVSESRLLLRALELKEAIESKKKVRFRVFHIGAKDCGGSKPKKNKKRSQKDEDPKYEFVPAKMIRADGLLDNRCSDGEIEAWPLALDFVEGSFYLLVGANQHNGRGEMLRSFDLAEIQGLAILDGCEEAEDRPKIDENEIDNYLYSSVHGRGSSARAQKIGLLCNEWGLDILCKRFGLQKDFKIYREYKIDKEKSKPTGRFRVQFAGYPFVVTHFVKRHMGDIEIEDVEVIPSPRQTKEDMAIPKAEYEKGAFGDVYRESVDTHNIKKARVSVARALNSAIIDHPGECDLARFGQQAFRAANRVPIEASAGEDVEGGPAGSAAPANGSTDGGTLESESAKTEAVILEGQLTEDEQKVLEAYRAYRSGLLKRKRAREA